MQRPGEVSLPEYRIFETVEFARSVNSLPLRDGRAIRKKLTEYVYPQIREVPFFGANIKKLRGYTPDTWRYRIGRFRAFYTVDKDERVVYVLTVELRRDAYR
ncbi:MAG: type II toxin-antitoxin system RelE/ParE family toxin [Chloroflexi bacterium]|nr:type II toxin-antitoxin system RelE/ParE family toxin [Chloroflexota bacterium]